MQITRKQKRLAVSQVVAVLAIYCWIHEGAALRERARTAGSSTMVNSIRWGLHAPKEAFKAYPKSSKMKKRLACALARRFTLSQNGYGTQNVVKVSLS